MEKRTTLKLSKDSFVEEVNSHRWWHNSALLLNSVLTIAYFDRLGLPRLS